MSVIDTGDLKTGFWLGLGLLIAFGVWGFVSLLLHRAGARDG